MKPILLLSAAAVLAAGCATTEEPMQVAQRECKIRPVTTESATGVRSKSVSSLEQRHAEMQLATSQYRMANLRSQGMAFNNVEEALNDCR